MICRSVFGVRGWKYVAACLYGCATVGLINYLCGTIASHFTALLYVISLLSPPLGLPIVSLKWSLQSRALLLFLTPDLKDARLCSLEQGLPHHLCSTHSFLRFLSFTLIKHYFSIFSVFHFGLSSSLTIFNVSLITFAFLLFCIYKLFSPSF